VVAKLIVLKRKISQLIDVKFSSGRRREKSNPMLRLLPLWRKKEKILGIIFEVVQFL